MAQKATTEKPTESKPSFEELYNELLNLKEDTLPETQQKTFKRFANQYSNLFNFQKYNNIVTKDCNLKLFTLITKSLILNKNNYDLQASMFQTVRVLSRSKIGVDVLFKDDVK